MTSHQNLHHSQEFQECKDVYTNFSYQEFETGICHQHTSISKCKRKVLHDQNTHHPPVHRIGVEDFKENLVL